MSESGPASIAEAFVRNAERAPGRLCLRFEGEEISYNSMRQRAKRFGAALEAWGLRPGERVALFLGNHPDLLAAYLGTHLAGGVVVPVNTQYRRGELRHIFGDAIDLLIDVLAHQLVDGPRRELGFRLVARHPEEATFLDPAPRIFRQAMVEAHRATQAVRDFLHVAVAQHQIVLR